MPLTLIPFENPTLVLADTEAGLATGDAFECQLTTAELIAAANLVQVEQTPCNPPSQIPGRESWSLHVIWYQDWTAAGGGLSGYAKANRGTTKWFKLVLDALTAPTVAATGQVWIGSGGFGGQVGPTPVKADVTWPCFDEPDITTPAPALAADELVDEPEPATV
ncbi:MAG TPA: hypothetical protein VIX41_08855 [Acidimicrobiales bacterium]